MFMNTAGSSTTVVASWSTAQFGIYVACLLGACVR